jgi:hypothetical protein
MSIVLRIVLVVVSLLVAIYAFRKIRKAQLNIDDAIYWIVASILLFVLSIFPGIAIFASDLLGILSPANFVFLVMIFLVLIKLFSLSVDLSIQKYRLNSLIERLAIIHKDNADSDKK